MRIYIREILLERGQRQITNTAVGGCMQNQRHLHTTRFGIALVAALRTPLFLGGPLTTRKPQPCRYGLTAVSALEAEDRYDADKSLASPV